MRIQIGAYDKDGLMLEDWSPFGRDWSFSTGERGSEACTGLVRKSNYDAAYWRERRGQVFVRATAGGARLFDGRLEDVATVSGGIRVKALGGFRAYVDVRYTRLWSTTGYAGWEPVTVDDDSNYSSELYELDNNNRLYIAPLTSQTYSVGNERGGLVLKSPHNGEGPIKAVSFTYSMPAGLGWSALLVGYDEGFTSAATAWTLAGSGSAQSGAAVVTLATAKDYLVLVFYRPSSGASFTTDIGSVYIKLTNVRVTSTVANAVNTTLGTTIAPGTRTVTPGSMTNIYVGQALVVGTGASTERVLVTAVTSTTFTAVFAIAHSNTHPVEALYVSAEEIVGSLVGYVAGVNADQVSTSTALIEATDRDLLNAVWEDAFPADILVELAGLHDFEVGVGASSLNGRTLYFRPSGAEGRTWYVDASIELERTLEAVWNSAYGVYSDDRGRLRRTAVSTNADSVEEFGIVRREAVFADTSDDDRAEDFRDDFLRVSANPSPRAGIFFNLVFTAEGVIVPLFFVAAGDYVVARNVPGNPVFLVARTDYLIDTNELMVEPLVRPPTVAESLAKGVAGLERAVRIQRAFREKVRVL